MKCLKKLKKITSAPGAELQWNERCWDKAEKQRSAEKTRVQRIGEEMRKAEMTWEEMRRVVISWEAPRKGDKTWDEVRWNEMRWHEVRWKWKRIQPWEKIALEWQVKRLLPRCTEGLAAPYRHSLASALQAFHSISILKLPPPACPALVSVWVHPVVSGLTLLISDWNEPPSRVDQQDDGSLSHFSLKNGMVLASFKKISIWHW